MTEDWETMRRAAFGAAYRMLGSVADAEDVAQSAIARLLALEPERRPSNPSAWLITVATRIAVDELRSARSRREEYVGEWLPEPIVGPLAEDATDASTHAELADELSFAFLVLLESLSPSERAALLLHDVFDYSYDEVASVLDRPSQAAVRQLVSRARAHVTGRAHRYPAPPSEQHELVSRFISAVESGAVDDFVALLLPDVTVTSDSGGNAPRGFALSRSMHGAVAVAKFLGSFRRRATFPAHMEAVAVNGGPGVAIIADVPDIGGVMGIMALDVRDGRIAAILGVLNPDKLRHLAPELGHLADLDALRAMMPAAHEGS